MNNSPAKAGSQAVSKMLAKCGELLRRKDHDQAWAVICEAVAAEPGNMEVRSCRARIALVTNRPRIAHDDFAEVVRQSPKNVSALSGLAMASFLVGDLPAANHIANQALALSPKDEESAQVKRKIEQALAANRAGPSSPPGGVPAAPSTIRDISKQSRTYEVPELVQRNVRFKNLHSGQRCFIIGNGPSTKLQNLSCLKDEITIAVNEYTRNPVCADVRSDYWLLADPLYWQQPDIYFTPAVQRAVDYGLCPNLFVPTAGFGYFCGVRPGPFINVNYYHFSNVGTEADIDFCKGIPPHAQNVVIVALMLAFHLGCNPIYLIGVDHDILNLTKEEYEDFVSPHSYDEPEAPQEKLSQQMSWEDWLAAKERMLFQYNDLNRYARRRGIEIIDATRDGHLEVYPKVRFEDLFVNGCGPKKAWPIQPDTSTIPMLLLDAAVKLIDSGKDVAALALLDQTLDANLVSGRPVHGIQYLRATCLARLGRLAEALLAAREDYAGNVANRNLSGPLVNSLEAEIRDVQQASQ